MARAKVTTTFDLGKLGRNLDKIIASSMNQWGNRINKRIKDGVSTGMDIDGRRFEPLSASTKSLGGKNPLNRSGNMNQTKKIPSTPANLNFTIKMDGRSSRTGAFYGAFHNEGFTNSNKPKQWFKSATIPARKWFGISKELQPGGSETKKIMLHTHLQIRRKWSKLA